MAALRVALCNEVLRESEFSRQCALAAELGYDGLELAPFTVSDAPHLLSPARCAELRRAAQDAGIAISGLHWLLIKPAGLSITDPDIAVRNRTIEVMRRLVDLCAALGGSYLVHGSPAQRRLPEDPAGAAIARAYAAEAWQQAGRAAAAAGVAYCIEPLSRNETNLVNTIGEAVELIARVDQSGLATMLDISAATRTEAQSPVDLLGQYFAGGLIRHVHANDVNRRGPGQGDTAIAPVLRALHRLDYRDWVGVEPFDYVPDGPTSAARAIGYLRGIEAAL